MARFNASVMVSGRVIHAGTFVIVGGAFVINAAMAASFAAAEFVTGETAPNEFVSCAAARDAASPRRSKNRSRLNMPVFMSKLPCSISDA